MTRGKANNIEIIIDIDSRPMSDEAWERFEDLIATMVAKAIWAEHELSLGDSEEGTDDEK